MRIHYKLRKSKGNYVGGHAPYSRRLLKELQKHKYKIIQIVRDPRDVIASFVRWIVDRPDFFAYPLFAPLSVEERINTLISGGSLGQGLEWEPFASVLDRSLGWLTDDNVLVVRFEDLVGERGGGSKRRQLEALQDISNYLGIEKDLEKISHHLYGDTPTFRKGVIGSWQEMFTRENLLLFEKRIGKERLRLWGYR